MKKLSKKTVVKIAAIVLLVIVAAIAVKAVAGTMKVEYAIELSGEGSQVVSINQVYEDAGVEFVTNRGGRVTDVAKKNELMQEVQTVGLSKVDTSTVGTYQVYYLYKDQELVRTITVQDEKSNPVESENGESEKAETNYVITLSGVNPCIIKVGSVNEYKDEGIWFVTDEKWHIPYSEASDELKSEVKVTGLDTVNVNAIGCYVVGYEYKQQRVERIVVVQKDEEKVSGTTAPSTETTTANGSTTQQPQTTKPAQTQTPAQTQAPSQTQKPAQTTQPTQAPSQTQNPSTTEKPQPKKYDMSQVKFEDKTCTYDGSKQSIFVTGSLPKGVTVSYEGNEKTEAGSYKVIAHFKGSSDYEAIPDMVATLKIKKASYDMSGVKFEDQTFTYDGGYHNIKISGKVPSGVIVSYVNDGQKDVGTYIVTAKFTGDKNYNDIPDMTAKLIIKSSGKKTYDMSKVKFENRTFTYDGLPFVIEISGELPKGVTVSYENNVKVDAGSYKVIAHFKGSSDYEAIPDMVATLKIKKASYDMSGVKFEGQTFTYDGEYHSIKITGELPSGVKVSYKGNKKKDVGSYTVTAKFTNSNKNYNDIPDMTANMVIKSSGKLDYDMSQVKFEDKTYTYDGHPYWIEISGELPKGVKVSYENNAQVDAGTYKVIAHFKGDDDHNPIEDKVATLEIKKADYNMDGVKFLDQKVTFDGKAHNIEVIGTLPKGMTVTYENNGQINAGVYKVTASFKGDANHNTVDSMSATLTIEKADLNMTGVKFEDKTVVYDGKAHSLAVVGLPDGVKVSYENNNQVLVGSYVVIAHFDAGANYNAVRDMYAILTIEASGKLDYDMSKVKFTNEAFVYDGKEHSIFVTGELPEGVSVTYENNGKVAAGGYEVTAHFKGDDRHNPIDDMTAMIIIKRADVDMSGIRFEDQSFVYDGNEHSLSITGTLPAEVSVTYENNAKKMVGKYVVTAHFNVSDNYKSVKDMSAIMTITEAGKADYDMSKVSFESQSVVYDGKEHNLMVAGELPEGVTVTYTGNGRTEAGSYEVIAQFKGDDLHNPIKNMVATLVIEKATYNMDGVSFESQSVTYEGAAHSLSVTGTLPEGVSVSYVGNDRIEIGEYQVIARFTGSSNYNDIPDKAATLTITAPAETKVDEETTGEETTGGEEITTGESEETTGEEVTGGEEITTGETEETTGEEVTGGEEITTGETEETTGEEVTGGEEITTGETEETIGGEETASGETTVTEESGTEEVTSGEVVDLAESVTPETSVETSTVDTIEG